MGSGILTAVLLLAAIYSILAAVHFWSDRRLGEFTFYAIAGPGCIWMAYINFAIF